MKRRSPNRKVSGRDADQVLSLPWTADQTESLARHFRLRPGMAVLDAGTRDGVALRNWGPYCLPGGSLTGVVPGDGDVALCERLARTARLGRAASFAAGDVNKLPFKNNSFDLTMANVVLSGQAKPEAVLDELIRVTKRGGCVAVFDQAILCFGVQGWVNFRVQSTEERTFTHSMGIRMVDGRRKLALGDSKVAFHVPEWLSARGFKDIGVRAVDKVNWGAPPYRAETQKVEIAESMKQLQDTKAEEKFWLYVTKCMRAGGADEKSIRRMTAIRRRYRAHLKTTMAKGAIAWLSTVPGLCIWGFKP